MKLQFAAERLADYSVDSLVLFVPQYDKLADKKLRELDAAADGALTTLLESGEFSGKTDETAVVLCPDGYGARRVILVGLGESGKINADSYRKAAGSVSRHKSLMSSAKAAFHLVRTEKEGYFQAIIEGYLLGSYKLLKYKTGESKKDKNKLATITFALDSRRPLSKIEKAVERGRIVAEGQLLVRDLASTPGDELTPSALAETAARLASENKVKCRVLDEKAIEKEKMGALLAVARGSVQPPRFVILEYNGGRAGQKPVVLVGKGITFDSGGISLKPGQDMWEMKGDMTGAAVVISAIITAARLRLPLNLVALAPAAENMPSGKAIKPGDIVTSRKGLTIEVINTDAEGRLILADALDYADKFRPQAVIDVATLTGAALYVLGYSGAPFFTNRPELSRRISRASDVTGERTWAMPIWDDHRELMKSPIADLANTGGRPAGTITAAAFLENFIGDWPWAHIDIAYVDLEPKGRPYIPKGATGIGLRLLIEVLSRWKKL
jgi:leucyl aminopeptidase